LKKDKEALIFGILYILVFTLIYVAVFSGIEGFLFILLIILLYNLPSLITVLLLLFIERKRTIPIPKSIYFITSIAFFFISFIFWNSGSRIDSKNIYPILNQSIHIIILYSILSHFIALIILKTTTLFKSSKNGS